MLNYRRGPTLNTQRSIQWRVTNMYIHHFNLLNCLWMSMVWGPIESVGPCRPDRKATALAERRGATGWGWTMSGWIHGKILATTASCRWHGHGHGFYSCRMVKELEGETWRKRSNTVKWCKYRTDWLSDFLREKSWWLWLLADEGPWLFHPRLPCGGCAVPGTTAQHLGLQDMGRLGRQAESEPCWTSSTPFQCAFWILRCLGRGLKGEPPWHTELAWNARNFSSPALKPS